MEIAAAFVCGGVAVVVAFGFMFATPHTSFAEYVNNDNGGATVGTVNTSCVTPWNYLVGNPDTVSNGAGTLHTQDLEATNSACVTAIQDREHVVIVLLVVGAGLVMLGIVWQRRKPATER